MLKKADQLEHIQSFVESSEGHIVHVFPPRLLHVYATDDTRSLLNNSDLIQFVTDKPVNCDTIKVESLAERMGLTVWNNLFITTVKFQNGIMKKEPDASPLAATETAFGNDGFDKTTRKLPTSEYLIGSVSVGIIFVESDGSVDTKTETWTKEDKEDIETQIYTGLDWWSNMGGYRANASWVYDLRNCQTRYEPISHTKEESVLWINECMDRLGYPNGEDYERARIYANDLREKNKTDWSFVMFLVPARNDADGYFADKSGIAWAYVGGPYLVVPNQCNSWGFHNVWKVIAHETGHVFHALDEYEQTYFSAAAVSNVIGRDSLPRKINGACMMRSNDLVLCELTRKQIGWVDDNHDGVFDSDHRSLSSTYHHKKMIEESIKPINSNLLFYENFSGQNDWFEDQNNYIINGFYRMFDSAYGSSSWLERDYFDFTASVKTQWEQGSLASGYGLMLRVKTATDGYIFFINRHGQFAFGKYVNSSWKYLEPWTYSTSIHTSGYNTLKATCVGNRFTLYINDVQVADTSDDTFIYGNVGLTVLPDVQVTFDDLSVVSP